MEHVCTGIQQEFLNWSEQLRQLLTGKRSLTIVLQLMKRATRGDFESLRRNCVLGDG